MDAAGNMRMSDAAAGAAVLKDGTVPAFGVFSDSSTGKNSAVSCVEHEHLPTPDSAEDHDKEPGPGDQVQRLSTAQAQSEAGSLQLKNQLKNILDSMFVA
jgi:hypothetical protein